MGDDPRVNFLTAAGKPPVEETPEGRQDHRLSERNSHHTPWELATLKHACWDQPKASVLSLRS